MPIRHFESDSHLTKLDEEREVGRIVSTYLRSSSSSNLLKKPILNENDPAFFRPPNSGWSSQIEFLFTCISYAVGLGNVWRFPYLCYKNGGGAFLFPYIIMLVLVGMPTFFLEICFGQFASLGPLTIWSVNPFFKGLGYALVAVSWVIGLYYVVIIAQCALFFFSSMQGQLPWDSCGNDWNTEKCVDPALQMTENNTAEIGEYNFTKPTTLQTGYTYDGRFAIAGTKTEEFYYNFVLSQSPNGISDIGTPHWPLTLCFLFCWILVAAGLIKGVASLGKISYFTAIFPYVMLTILFIRSVTLPGAADGIRYYLTPDFNRLKDLFVWQEAANQIFYNLSCATGGLIAMASFNHFKNNCFRDALIVPILNACTSVFAGLVVFSVLGFMAYSKNTTVDKVASDGPGLIFIVYPEALAKLPVGPLWAILFFLMMMTLGFGTELSFVETVLTAFQDDLHGKVTGKWQNIAFRIGVCVLGFLLGLPMVCRGGIYVLQIFDFYISFISLLLIPFLEMFVLAWIYGFPNFQFSVDVDMMLGRPPPIFFKIMWRYVSPVALLILFFAGLGLYSPPSMSIGGIKYPFPDFALSVGWFIALVPIIPIPAWMIYYHCYLNGFENLREQVRPMINWGPREQEFRTGRYALQTKAIAALQAIRASASQLNLAQQKETNEKTAEDNAPSGVSIEEDIAPVEV